MTKFWPFGPACLEPNHPVASRKADHSSSLAYRPVGQEVLINGLMLAHKKSRLSPAELVSRLDDIPRKLAAKPWVGILAGSNGKMITKNKALASNLVAWYLIGDRIGAKLVNELEVGWREIHGGYQLPTPKN